MATLLPPPKRVKVYHGVPEPEPEPPKPSSNIVVQFVSEDDGQPLAPAVNLPANLSREALEGLLNKLSPQEDPVPFSFHVQLPEDEVKIPGAPTRIVISKSIEDDILNHPINSRSFTEEDVFVVHCSPQSVFRVRPPTRCSSTLSGHSSPILCASFSPTGNFLATGSGDTTARLWNLDTETPSHTLSGHKGWVLCVEWEAMERRLATGGHDGHVRIWDPKTGKPFGEALKGHSKWITSLCWEPIHLFVFSTLRLTSSSKDHTVRVWSLLTRRVEFTLGGHTASVNVVKWGGVGKGVLYTASSDRTHKNSHWRATPPSSTRHPSSSSPAPTTTHSSCGRRSRRGSTAVNGATPTTKTKPLGRLVGHSLQVSHVSFSPDGRWAASASWDSSVRIWEGRTGKYVATLRGHVGGVYRVAWSADGRGVVSCGKDSTVKTWDLKTYKLKNDLTGHTDEVYCVDFVADKIVSGGRDRTVKMCASSLSLSIRVC
ncbi:hypothetical protein MVEN_00769500 [Mycena venus]|uniref:NLE domain-containing protein n=1 Tax=Mycena venus TaxID=2733690 RepID=A0A8H6YKS6_9AGAR|nr:hypothetical protein MVEN_00769500 [Mycena venus]